MAKMTAKKPGPGEAEPKTAKTGAAAVGTVSVTDKQGTNLKPPVAEKVADVEVEGDPVKLRYALGMTLSTGVQFEFVRIDVGIEVPCAPEELEDAYALAKGWVEGKMAAEVAEVNGAK